MATQRYYFGTTNYVIMRYDMASQAVVTVAGTGVMGSLDGTGTSASVGLIYGMVFAPTGTLYFSDLSSFKVRSFNSITGAVVTLAGTGVSAYLDATGTAAAFRSPRGIALDATSSNLIVVRQESTVTAPLGTAHHFLTSHTFHPSSLHHRLITLTIVCER